MDTIVPAKVVGEWLGLSARSITDLAQRGIAIKTGRSQYDLPATVARYAAHLREVAAGRGGEDQVLDLTAERARLAKEQADGQEIKNARDRRELLAASDVEREWGEICLKIRSMLLAVPSRVRTRTGLSVEVAAAVDREIRDALEALGNDENDAPQGAGEATAAT